MKLTQNHIMELRKVAKRDWPAGEPRMTWLDRRWAASLLPVAVSLLWRVAPDVYLPRLLAILLYLVTALLAGRLAQRLGGHLAGRLSAATSVGGQRSSSSWGRSPQAPFARLS